MVGPVCRSPSAVDHRVYELVAGGPCTSHRLGRRVHLRTEHCSQHESFTKSPNLRMEVATVGGGRRLNQRRQPQAMPPLCQARIYQGSWRFGGSLESTGFLLKAVALSVGASFLWPASTRSSSQSAPSCPVCLLSWSQAQLASSYPCRVSAPGWHISGHLSPLASPQAQASKPNPSP